MTPSYIPIRKVLGRLRSKAIVMLKAYFDESGDEDKPFICMGGAIADEDDWEKFEDEWEEVLIAYQVKQLHTAQLMAHEPREEYKGWSHKKRDCFLSDLVPIVMKTVRLYVGAAESMEQHRLHPNPKADPYFQCYFNVLDGAVQYAKDQGPNEQVLTFFATHPEHTDRSREYYPKVQAVGGMYERLAVDAHGSPKLFLPLQAADLIAWHYRREIERRYEGCRWSMEPILSKFGTQLWCNNGYFKFDKWPRIERRAT